MTTLYPLPINRRFVYTSATMNSMIFFLENTRPEGKKGIHKTTITNVNIPEGTKAIILHKTINVTQAIDIRLKTEAY